MKKTVLNPLFASLLVAPALLLNACSGDKGDEMTDDDDAVSDDQMSDDAADDTTSDDTMSDDTMANDSAADDTSADDMMGDDGMADDTAEPKDPAETPVVEVDRFSEDAAMLMVRTPDNGLPGPDEPVDFDQPPFITQGLGPNGEVVRYYNFDVQSTEPAPIYVFFEDGADAPVEGQLNVIDVIPGDEGYNDFWQVHRVTVPDGYVANTVTSLTGIEDAGWDIEATELLVNCPVVPDGSTAELRLGGAEPTLTSGWYKDEVVKYFSFEEVPLVGTSVPLSPIYVTFNKNPDQEGGGPASGFMTEADSEQTHNVVATLPGDDAYSPLWLVNVLDNAGFADVMDLATAEEAELLAGGVANVNCPIVDME